MKIAISQPRYLPALNYFQRIYFSDIFVILDNVQHQKRAFEHRNKIKSVNGEGVWCSIPLKKKSSRPIIKSLETLDLKWITDHKRVIIEYYKKADFFSYELLDLIYKDINTTDFVETVMKVTINICSILDIKYNFIYSSTLDLDYANDKLLYEITNKLKGTHYISGPGGRNYIDPKIFNDIKLLYHEYEFPEYKQLHGKFVPWVSIIDQLFNIGVIATKDFIIKKPIFKEN